MIECTDAKIFNRRNRRKNKKRFCYFFVALIMLSLCYLYSRFLISSTISSVCANYTYSYGAQAVNIAVCEQFSARVEYNDLIKIEKNSLGDIAVMSANSVKINTLSQAIVLSTKKNLDEALSRGIPIPWLAFSGLKMLAGYGEKVLFKTISVAAVTCEFDSAFSSAGLNQTLHSIYALINWEVRIDIPMNSNVQSNSTRVLIGEAVIVGKVPEIYLNGKLFS